MHAYSLTKHVCVLDLSHYFYVVSSETGETGNVSCGESLTQKSLLQLWFSSSSSYALYALSKIGFNKISLDSWDASQLFPINIEQLGPDGFLLVRQFQKKKRLKRSRFTAKMYE